MSSGQIGLLVVLAILPCAAWVINYVHYAGDRRVLKKGVIKNRGDMAIHLDDYKYRREIIEQSKLSNGEKDRALAELDGWNARKMKQCYKA